MTTAGGAGEDDGARAEPAHVRAVPAVPVAAPLLLVLPAIAAFALCVMLLQVLSPAVVHAQAAAPAVFR